MGKKIRMFPFLFRTGKFKDGNEVMRLIKDGKVKVDDRVIINPIFEFRPNTKSVYINGKKIEGQKEELYFIFNKPQGVICQKNDPKGRPSIWDWLKSHSDLKEEEINSLVSVGRIDINTEGLLILTNDSSIVNHVLQPKNHIEKEYYAIVKDFLSDKAVSQLEEGIDIIVGYKGKKKKIHALPAKVRILSRNQSKSEIMLEICEGKRRQVREMLNAVGNPVTFLRRERIGKILLEDLKVGKIKNISKEEIQNLLFK